ncbi:hypothetical protein PV05_09919 [Exophiala xenobiotica]|uniref:BHLH domain-containing protein n=1 Tax=Exophiala xenobiotica TaxID=348802 RepID=A0A0D2E932_9EURO|nr:uncharacterized protein PV05_09919 [Exophiala xenobiotica]KIW51175.1 hypothetical protein PV05_09919 [Exophiala xenobiotica]
MSADGPVFWPNESNDDLMVDYSEFLDVDGSSGSSVNGGNVVTPLLPLYPPWPFPTKTYLSTATSDSFCANFNQDHSAIIDSGVTCYSEAASSPKFKNNSDIFRRCPEASAQGRGGSEAASCKRSRRHQDGAKIKALKHTRQMRWTKDENSSVGDSDEATKKKQAHTVIERRYRDKLNNNIKQLYHTLLEAKQGSRVSPFQFSDHRDFRAPPRHIKKSDIINDAINYIHQTEVDIRHMKTEISHLQAMVQMLEQQERLMAPTNWHG